MWPRADEQELINALPSFVQSDPIKSEEPGGSQQLHRRVNILLLAELIDHRIIVSLKDSPCYNQNNENEDGEPLIRLSSE